MCIPLNAGDPGMIGAYARTKDDFSSERRTEL